MKQLTVAVAGAAILVASISGCSSNKSSTASSGTSGASATSEASGAEGRGTATVVIDGQSQNDTRPVVCTTSNGSVDIKIGHDFRVVLTDADPPTVNEAHLGTLDGYPLLYNTSSYGNASATKNGSTYKITGNAIGYADSQPHPFELDVTCS